MPLPLREEIIWLATCLNLVQQIWLIKRVIQSLQRMISQLELRLHLILQIWLTALIFQPQQMGTARLVPPLHLISQCWLVQWKCLAPRQSFINNKGINQFIILYRINEFLLMNRNVSLKFTYREFYSQRSTTLGTSIDLIMNKLILLN